MNENMTKLRHLGKNMRSPEDVREFDRLLGVFYDGNRDPETLKNLLTVFSDKCQYPEVMYGLVHLVETWPDEIYVRGILESLKELLHKAEGWTDVLVNRILNEEKCCNAFKQNIAKVQNKSLNQLFDIIKKHSPHQIEKLDGLKNLVGIKK